MSLSPTEEAINRGDPIRLHRSEFLEKPAEYLIQADDRDTIIELCRYQKVTHAVIPLDAGESHKYRNDMSYADLKAGSDVGRRFYRYDWTTNQLHERAALAGAIKKRNEASDGDITEAMEDEVVGQVITVRPYRLSEYMKDMGYCAKSSG